MKILGKLLSSIVSKAFVALVLVIMTSAFTQPVYAQGKAENTKKVAATLLKSIPMLLPGH